MKTSGSLLRYLISVLFLVVMLRVIRVANDDITFRKLEANDASDVVQCVFEDGYWFKMYIRPTLIWGGFWERELFVIDSNGDRYKQIWDLYYGKLFFARSNSLAKHFDVAHIRPLEKLIKRIELERDGFIRGAHSPNWLVLVDVLLSLSAVGILFFMWKWKTASP